MLTRIFRNFLRIDPGAQPFLMDATPATPYMLLLFGGKLAMPDPARQMVVVDDWLHLHASARVAGTTSGAPTFRVSLAC